MISYKVSSDYNQTMSIGIGDAEYRFVFRSFRDLWYCTVYDIDGKLLAANVRCVNKEWLLPRRYARTLGNFRFEGLPESYIHPQYSDRISLLYYYADEIEDVE